MVQKNFFIRVIMMLCLFWAGASSAWAYDFEIKGVQYTLVAPYFGGGYYAVVTGYTGTAETLTIPAYVSNGSTTYKVDVIKDNNEAAPVDISSVKTLIFEGFVYLNGNSSNPTFNCPALTDIIFKGGSPTLNDSFSKYFGTRTGITAHVSDKTDDEIATLKNSTAVWSNFANIVPYNEAESETVNVYVTVEHAWAVADGTTISTAGTDTRTITKNKHANFYFEAVNSYSTYDLYEVYVNGKNVKDEMNVSDAWYNYTVTDITSDVYIRIVGKQKGKDCWAATSDGATVTIKVNDETAQQITEYSMFNKNLVSTDQIEITYTPNEGYELSKFYYGVSNIADIDLFKPVDQGDGSYKISFTFGTLTSNVGSLAGCNLILVFKPTGSGSGSGSGTTTGFDLNQDGKIDVSDIDKLIEEINKQ